MLTPRMLTQYLISTRYTLGIFGWIVVSCLMLALGLYDRASAQTVLDGHENHLISLTQAIELTHNFQSTKMLNTAASDTALVVAEYFGRDAIAALLAQSDCVGIRIYYGRKDTGVPVLVLVSVNAKGDDMTDGLLEEIGFPCPPICPSTKTLIVH